MACCTMTYGKLSYLFLKLADPNTVGLSFMPCVICLLSDRDLKLFIFGNLRIDLQFQNIISGLPLKETSKINQLPLLSVQTP